MALPLDTRPTTASNSEISSVPEQRLVVPVDGKTGPLMKPEEREMHFTQRQEIRRKKFDYYEAERDSKYVTRQKDLQNDLDRRKESFRVIQLNLQDSFNDRQKSRDQCADTRRGHFDTFLARIQEMFEQEMTFSRERYRAEEQSLVDCRLMQEHQASVLFTSMQGKVKETLKNLAGVELEDDDTLESDVPMAVHTKVQSEHYFPTNKQGDLVKTRPSRPRIGVPSGVTEKVMIDVPPCVLVDVSVEYADILAHH